MSFPHFLQLKIYFWCLNLFFYDLDLSNKNTKIQVNSNSRMKSTEIILDVDIFANR